MKVLFLDVDGVINIPAGMDPNLLENLRGVIETTGAKIVLSSDWRRTVRLYFIFFLPLTSLLLVKVAFFLIAHCHMITTFGHIEIK